MASVKINNTGGEVDRLQEKQRAAVSRSVGRARGQDMMIDPYDSPPGSATVYPDLQDINFGDIGGDQK